MHLGADTVGKVQNRGGEVRRLKSNYAFKPTAEQALRTGRGASCRGGLTRR